jgi:hypothetical protein
MSIDNLQYYPTPLALATKAWKLFKNKHFIRVLEPSAGEGHLVTHTEQQGEETVFTQMINVALRVEHEGQYYRRSNVNIDCLEVDVSKHHILRQKGLEVVGLDFLKFKQGAIYSHIILNPPFSFGVQHLLHAWNILYDGEIVAIINAETIKNAFSKERQHLVNLIEKYGSVEFLQEEFVEAERKTDVEIALVYLRKESNISNDICGDILDKLKRDQTEAEDLMEDYREINAVVLPKSFVENQVNAFNAAVLASKEAIFARQRAEYYANVLGNTMECINGGNGLNQVESVKELSKSIHTEFKELKNRAWTSILRSTEVTSRLSSEAQKRLTKEFEVIKCLEFDVANIYGFLAGLSSKQGDIQIDMACDVFDSIGKYHSDNTIFHIGWKSNDMHRTCGMKIKTTRFILPNNTSWNNSLDWDARQRLGDIDKVFAMLDGKHAPEVSLASVFENQFKALKSGERIDASYFSVRFYPGIGTIHFFPKSKKLIDRLNRLVGRHREWLPPEGEKVNEAFWIAYENSEKLDKEFRAELNSKATSRYDDPLWGITSHQHDNRATASKKACDAIETVLERHGININAVISKDEVLMLEAA